MASAKATATRASVAPRLKASAPERASLTIMSATACGSGSMRGPASCAPTYQAAISSASETAATPRSLLRPVEGAAVELARRAHQLGAADLGQHA